MQQILWVNCTSNGSLLHIWATAATVMYCQTACCRDLHFISCVVQSCSLMFIALVYSVKSCRAGSAEDPAQVKLQEAPLQKGRIVRDEDRATGKVKLHHYHNYLSAWGPYFIVPGLLLAGYIGQQGSMVCPSAMLTHLGQCAIIAAIHCSRQSHVTLYRHSTAYYEPSDMDL